MKYIVDIDDFEPLFKVDSIGVFGIGKSVTYSDNDHSWSRIKSVEEFEELNSDYINEHYSSLQDEAYQRGLNDAWEAAKKLFSTMADSDIEKVFPIEWNNGGFHALINLQPQEAIEKLKAYEEKQNDKIVVGDEFVIDTGERFVVLRVDENGEVDKYFDSDGRTYRMNVKYSSMKKTGRHFDIASILEDMRND